MSDLSNVKVGDTLAYFDNFHGWMSATVARLTKKQIITKDGRRWWRVSGTLVGASGYNTPSLRVMTWDIVAKVQAGRARRIVSNIAHQTLTDEQAIRVAAAIKAAMEEPNE